MATLVTMHCSGGGYSLIYHLLGLLTLLLSYIILGSIVNK